MSPPKRKPETTEQLRASLVAHALRVIARDGAGALTMRALAAEAGCAVGLPYKVFTDRRELVGEIVHTEFDRLRNELGGMKQRAGTGTVAANLASLAELLLDSPAVELAHEVIGDEDLTSTVTARATGTGIGPAAFEKAFSDYLAAEKQIGRVRREIDEYAQAFLLAGAIHNLIVSGAAYPRPSRRRLRQLLAATADTIVSKPEPNTTEDRH